MKGQGTAARPDLVVVASRRLLEIDRSRAVVDGYRRTMLLQHTAKITGAFVSLNHVPGAALPELIAKVYQALAKLAAPAVVAEKGVPAIRPEKSLRPDCIFCLEDGKRFKSIRRHLLVSHGLTPAQYRSRWGLPSTYPMVCSEYSAGRTKLVPDGGQRRKAKN